MPRRSVLSTAERSSLLAIPEADDELIRQYTFSAADLALIGQRRGDANRLGMAVQMALLRFPGQGLLPEAIVPAAMLRYIGHQLRIDPACWPRYAHREETRREHLLELRSFMGYQTFGLSHYRQTLLAAVDLGLHTDKGMALATSVLDALRQQQVIIPPLNVIERICAEAITRANRQIHAALTDSLTPEHRSRLDKLFARREGSQMTTLAWLRQSPLRPNSPQMLEHIERLKAWRAIDLPAGIERQVHHNRLLKIAREGGQMTPADLAKFEPQRRYATLVALAVEGLATVTDEIIELHERIIGRLFAAARNKHQQQFQASGKAINDKVRLYGRIGQALLEARTSHADAFAAIEAVMPWEDFSASVAEAQKLAQPEDFDFLRHVGDSYSTVRRYAPEFLDVLQLRAAPAAQGVLDAIEVLRLMNLLKVRDVPTDAPIDFVKKRWCWRRLKFDPSKFDRRGQIDLSVRFVPFSEATP